ncbi:polysaccharide pyruvyl transferase family protein [Pedobacter frigoris]|uniref:polysaccharide pyruvyl transferase family protein n=1 Tax=Pedobacter frigoris TaxID=2571272 RepID=UPI00292EB069|nr:polysaccharide pyruvyl transferase family protein [Pedobacter frigoris]
MNIEKLKKIVIFGSYNKQSVGDKAILISIIDLLFRNSANKIVVEVICFDSEAIQEELKFFPWSPSVNVVPFQENLQYAPGKKLSVGVKNKLGKFIPRSLIHAISSVKFYYNYKPKFDTNADLLIIGGGNLLMDLFPSWLIMPYVITRRFKCPYVIAGVGAFPIKTLFGSLIIKRLLKSSSLNYVRDKKTYDLVKKGYGIDCNLHPDFAFSYPTEVEENGDKNENMIAVNIAPIFSPQWPYSDEAKFENFINIIAEGLYYELLNNNAYNKLLFFDSNYPTDRLGALNIINKLLAMGIDKSRLVYKDEITSSQGIVNMLRGVKFCIVTRLHAGILALDAGVPVLGIAYQPKVRDVFHLAGLDKGVIDIKEIDGFSLFLRDFSENSSDFKLSKEVKGNLRIKNEVVIKRILAVSN